MFESEQITSEQAIHSIIEHTKHLVAIAIKNRGNDKPPFLTEEYARLLGVKNIIRTDLGKTSGLLLRFRDGPVIKINKNHNISRQNFSFAHELGHILFSNLKLEKYIKSIEYRTNNPQKKIQVRYTARERLCDAAATELLMPESVFIKYLLGFGVSIYSLERLSKIFGVSIKSTAIRIAEVSPEPCVALAWKPSTKNDILRLDWCTGPGLKLVNRIPYKPQYSRVKPPSTLHSAFSQNEYVKCHRSFKFGTELKSLPTESKGYGSGENRFVISLAFPER